MIEKGKAVHYYFNYSSTRHTVSYANKQGTELLSDKKITQNGIVKLEPWG